MSPPSNATEAQKLASSALLILTANDQRARFISRPPFKLHVQMILTQLHMLEPVITAAGEKRAPASQTVMATSSPTGAIKVVISKYFRFDQLLISSVSNKNIETFHVRKQFSAALLLLHILELPANHICFIFLPLFLRFPFLFCLFLATD